VVVFVLACVADVELVGTLGAGGCPRGEGLLMKGLGAARVGEAVKERVLCVCELFAFLLLSSSSVIRGVSAFVATAVLPRGVVDD
jgi:hypothetical protein